MRLIKCKEKAKKAVEILKETVILDPEMAEKAILKERASRRLGFSPEMREGVLDGEDSKKESQLRYK